MRPWSTDSLPRCCWTALGLLPAVGYWHTHTHTHRYTHTHTHTHTHIYKRSGACRVPIDCLTVSGLLDRSRTTASCGILAHTHTHTQIYSHTHTHTQTQIY